MKKYKLIIRLIITIITFVLLCYAFLETNTSKSTTRLVIYSILYLSFAVFLVFQITNRKLLSFLTKSELDSNRIESFHLLSTPIIFIGLFIILNKSFFLFQNSLFTYQNLPTTDDWLLFGLDLTVRSIGLDFLETFNINISNISTDNTLMMCWIFIYKTFLAFTFWSFVLKTFFAIKKTVANKS